MQNFRPVPKRRREEIVVVPDVASVSTTRETDSGEDQPRRKQRRSTRPVIGIELPRSESPQSEDVPKLGPEHQAEVPTEPLPRSFWKVHAPQVTSELVFSEQACGGAVNVNAYINTINEKLRRRDGFALAPFAMEFALQILCSSKGNAQQSMKEALRKIPRGPYFPGIKNQFKYEEQCLFVRTLAERAKNFSLISRDVLPHRSASELVWLYYTRHKQLWIQNGGMKSGLIMDDGGEKLKRVQLTSERTISSLRNLAITAGDGFPIDSRVNLAVLACRRGNLMKRKKQREEESLKGRTRLRNQLAEKELC